jgi:ketosteroid isomerase-like protein
VPPVIPKNNNRFAGITTLPEELVTLTNEMHMRIPLFLACIAAGVFSCKTGDKSNTPVFILDSVKSAIARSNAKFENAWATGDSTTMKSIYTSDGCMYPPAMLPLCGPTNIVAFFNGGYQMGIRRATLITNEVFGNDDFVWETGNYQMLDSGGTMLDRGKYIVIWKNENGWKMHRDIWNTDRPMANADGSLPK